MTQAELLQKFVPWAVAQGAQVVATTNEYEVLRLAIGTQTAVAYRSKKSGDLVSKMNREMVGAVRCWKERGKLWLPKTRRVAIPERLRAKLIERDGLECFFCGRALTDQEATVEHLVALAHRGPNHLSNLAIACEPCNMAAHHLSVVEKVRIRSALRSRKKEAA